MAFNCVNAEPVPACKCETPYAVRRPHASVHLLSRQTSTTNFEKLSEMPSPFKRQISLQLSDTSKPSLHTNLDRG